MARRKVWQDKVAEIFQGCTAEQANERLALARTIVNVLHPPKPKVAKATQARKPKVNAKEQAITDIERSQMDAHVAHSS